MNLITKTQWEIRQSYIKTLLSYGINQKALQDWINEDVSNEVLADMIRGLIKLGIKPRPFHKSWNGTI
jgi:hypothetical protein